MITYISRFFPLMWAFLLSTSSIIAQDKPNVILILADDLGWADVGFNGCPDIPTPALDQLASEGVVCTQAYVSAPYCSPSRAGLLTGRYQSRFGHDCNPPYAPEREDIGTPLSETFIPAYLKQNGYATAAIGKWHLGDKPQFMPTQRGFDHWFGFGSGATNYWGLPTRPDKAIFRNETQVEPGEISYLTDDFSAEAIQFIQTHQEEPFFVYLSYNAPHAPNHATAHHLEKTQHIEYGGRSVYGAMVAAIDEGVGKIDSTLKSLNLKENTLIIFLSDNGGRHTFADNRPYRGHKGMMFEGGLRVPFFLTWPQGLQESHRYDAPVIALDLLPTILAATKTQIEPSQPLDGQDLLPFLSGQEDENPHSTFYWRTVNGFEYAIRDGKYKLYKSQYKDTFLLFDLEKDSYERHDLAAQYPDIVRALDQKYQTWNQEMMPPLWIDAHPEHVIKEAKALEQTRKRSTRNNP